MSDDRRFLDALFDEEPDPQVVVCQGPPVCDLVGEAAFEAASNGCPWCVRTIVHPDGSETVTAPGRA